MTQNDIRLSYDKGTIRIEGRGALGIPNTKYDTTSHISRAYGMHYTEIIKYLNDSGLDFADSVQNFVPSPTLVTKKIRLRDYQKQAIKRWEESFMKGCVILPTGAGKTAIGLRAIQSACASALVIVPTIDLMEQWAGSISKHMRADGTDNNMHELRIGRLGGGQDDIQAITVATYDSAYIKAPILGNQFKLIIFDEVHHLPAPGYRTIAEQFISPYRLGLTATIEREDQMHEMIPHLVGRVIFRMGPAELSTAKHLAEHTIQRIQVDLTEEEQNKYEMSRSKFLSNLRYLGFKTPSMHTLKRLIMMSNRNKHARDAILAKNKATEIALNSSAKVDQLQKILADNKNVRTIIFTQNNKMVYKISDRFLIPFITYKTGRDERRDVLDGFRTGRYSAVVTSKILDEGVDVPDAELGIIVSGTGSGRELIQRLGRLLRPKKDARKAVLIELVSRHTRETGTSAKRMTALRKNSARGPNLSGSR